MSRNSIMKIFDKINLFLQYKAMKVDNWLARVLLQEDATVAKTAFLSFLSISQSSL